MYYVCFHDELRRGCFRYEYGVLLKLCVSYMSKYFCPNSQQRLSVVLFCPLVVLLYVALMSTNRYRASSISLSI